MTDPDPRLLRGIAHPMRSRILAELSACGPLRAADIARQLGIPANQASFHLRQLAKYGLVVDDPDLARDRRDRVWRPVEEGSLQVRLQDYTDTAAGRAAVTVFRRQAGQWWSHLVERAITDPGPGEDPSRMVSDSAIRLTPEERAEFVEELTSLVERWSRRTQGHDDSRRTHSVLMVVQDYPDLQDET